MPANVHKLAPKPTGYVIEKGVPMPTGNGAHALQFPLDRMEIGDSFVATAPMSIVTAAVHKYGKYHQKKFVTRKEGDGRRVWRIA